MKLPENVTCSQCILQVHPHFIHDENASGDFIYDENASGDDCHQNQLNFMLNLLPLSSLNDGGLLFQWTWIAANNWGECMDGRHGIGCGPQVGILGCKSMSLHLPLVLD